LSPLLVAILSGAIDCTFSVNAFARNNAKVILTEVSQKNHPTLVLTPDFDKTLCRTLNLMDEKNNNLDELRAVTTNQKCKYKDPAEDQYNSNNNIEGAFEKNRPKDPNGTYLEFFPKTNNAPQDGSPIVVRVKQNI
jgi:hypothetical protein